MMSDGTNMLATPSAPAAPELTTADHAAALYRQLAELGEPNFRVFVEKLARQRNDIVAQLMNQIIDLQIEVEKRDARIAMLEGRLADIARKIGEAAERRKMPELVEPTKEAA